jgi:hypothetical protein
MSQLDEQVRRMSNIHGQFFDACLDNQPGWRLPMQIKSGEKLFDIIIDFLPGDSQ